MHKHIAYSNYSTTTASTLCSKEVHRSFIAKPEDATCPHCLAVAATNPELIDQPDK